MEIRSQSLNSKPDGNTLTGYAALYNEPTIIADGNGRQFREVIKPGAFSNALLKNTILMLVGHDRREFLGRYNPSNDKSTLQLREDHKGLWFSLNIPATQRGAEARELVSRGDIDGCSFGWDEDEDDWDYKSSPPLRSLKQINLREISITPLPAYPSTSVSVREIKLNNLWRYKLKLRLLDI